MTEQKRPGADQSARAGEKVFRETTPITALPLSSQPECMTGYRLNRWLVVAPLWEACNG